MTTLLAYLTSRFVTQSENLATESLSFLLRSYPDAAAAFNQFTGGLAQGLPNDLRYHTQNWLAEDQAIPDLVGVTSDGRQPLVVEAKFWAGLTENQPTTYLQRLPADEPGLLLFVVPGARAGYLWDELVRRCAIVGLTVTAGASIGETRVGAVEPHVLALTSWRALLGALAVALENAHDLTALADLRQLEGLCDQQDEQAFLPLTSEELSGGIGRRLTQLGTLIDDATTALVADGFASIKGLTRSAWVGGYGRYLRLGPWESLLHVNFDRWARHRATPTWLRITDKRAVGAAALVDALAPLRHASPRRLLDDTGVLMIPVYLEAGADRDGALAQMLSQLREIRDLVVGIEPPAAIA